MAALCEVGGSHSSTAPVDRVVSLEISCGIFLEISGKITVLFRNNSAKNFREVCGRKFHETLMQLQRSNALIAFMR